MSIKIDIYDWRNGKTKKYELTNAPSYCKVANALCATYLKEDGEYYAYWNDDKKRWDDGDI